LARPFTRRSRLECMGGKVMGTMVLRTGSGRPAAASGVFMVLVGLVSVGAARAADTGAAARVTPITTEASLGTIDPFIVAQTLVVSPDSKHVAYVARRRWELLRVDVRMAQQ